MGMTDPIADMLTRIRNANNARFKSVQVYMSTMNVNIAKVLKSSGYIVNYEAVKDEQGHAMLKITLKYPDARHKVITDIKRVSKPGRRVYVSADKVPEGAQWIWYFDYFDFPWCGHRSRSQRIKCRRRSSVQSLVIKQRL